MPKISEIINQPLGSTLTNWFICDHCKIVDNNWDRIKVGTKCSNCNKTGQGATVFFNITVVNLIELMQINYHAKPFATNKRWAARQKKEYSVSVIIFYCTLVEVLFNNFLNAYMSKMKLPKSVQQRLLDDNMFVKQRMERLFPSLTGQKWNEFIKKLDEQVEIDYIETIEFSKKIKEARNKFTHKGNVYAINEQMSKDCMEHIWPLMSLFISIHNNLIAIKKNNR